MTKLAKTSQWEAYAKKKKAREILNYRCHGPLAYESVVRLSGALLSGCKSAAGFAHAVPVPLR
jgi:hypothetical protein